MKKLLFIDDDTDFLKSNRLYFERKNYEVFCLNKPNDAIPFLSSTAIDCIVLDIDMPDMTGFEVCQKIRDISGTPIIFLSGLADIKNRISSFQAGGDDFLAKPYDIIELELRIEARIRKNEQVFFFGYHAFRRSMHRREPEDDNIQRKTGGVLCTAV